MILNNKINKIFVVGTGISSFIIVNELIKKNIKPVIIDISCKYEKKNFVIKITKPYFSTNDLKKCSFFGGLFNVWKGVVSNYSPEDEFDALGKKISLDEKYLQKKLNDIEVDEKFVTLDNSKAIFVSQKKNQYNFKKKNLEIIGSKIFFNNDGKFNPYNLRVRYKEYLKKNYIKLIKAELLNFDEKFLHIKQDNFKIKKLDYKYCFVAAGTVGSAKIIYNTLKAKSIFFRSNKKFISFGFFKKEIITDLIKNFPIFQVTTRQNIQAKKVQTYSQVYTLEQLLNEFFNKKKNLILKAIFNNFIFKRIAVFYTSLDSDYSKEIMCDFNSYKFSLVGTKERFGLNAFLKFKKYFNSNYKDIKILPFFFSLPDKSGNHFTSIFKFENYKNETFPIIFDKFASFQNFNKVSFLDATTFIKNSFKSPTYLIIKNTLSIVSSIINKKKINN